MPTVLPIRVRGAASLCAFLLLSTFVRPPTAQALNWTWVNAAGGSATTASNWFDGVTNGVPAPNDNAVFGLAAGFNVSWATPADSLFNVSINSGRPRFNIASRLGVGNSAFVNSESLTVLTGTLSAKFWEVGHSQPTSLYATGATSRLVSNDSTQADLFGNGINGNVALSGGARFTTNSWIQIAGTASAICTTTVIGRDVATHITSGLVTLSNLGGGYRGDVLVGYLGNGVLQIANGGFADIAGDLFISKSATSTGLVHVYNTGALAPFLTVRGQTVVGPDDSPGGAANGELLVDKASATLMGLCDVKNGFIQVQNAGAVSAAGMLVGAEGSGTSETGGLLVTGAGSSATISTSLQIGIGTTGTCICNSIVTDLGASMTYTGASPFKVEGNADLNVKGNSLVQSSAEIDVRGQLDIQGTLVAPIVKITHQSGDWSTANAGHGSIRGRFSMAAGASLHLLSESGTLVTIGDSTATDGFASSGFTSMANDTLALLDKDGADVGNLILNHGTVRLPQGGVTRSGFFFQAAGGRVEGSLTNEGALVIGASDQLDIAGRLVQRTGYSYGKGTLHILPASALSARGPMGPKILLDGSLVFEMTPSRIVDSTGFQASATATSNFSIGSRSSGRWDTLVVLGPAQLGGTLALRTGPITFPQLGDTLTVLTATSISGTFSSVTVNGAPGAGQVSVIYGATSVKVVIIGAITGVSPGAPRDASRESHLTSVGTLRSPAFALNLVEPSRVFLAAYDVSGRERVVLVDGPLPSGSFVYSIPSALVPNGVIFVRAEIRGEFGQRTLRARAVRLR